jgi:hypothetical protein
MMMLLIKLSPPSPDVSFYDESAEAAITASEPHDTNAEAKSTPFQTTMDSKHV